MECIGDGTCLIQCDRSGVHSHCNINGCYINNICIHGCELHRCNNFVICEELFPLWYLNCNNSCCQNCNMIYGKITFLDDKWSYCDICSIFKKMIKLPCYQECCFDCYKKYCDKSQHSNCPLCGNVVWKQS